ncbi:heterokaryon incompatibility protein Het-C-domain-containing protein [Schizophyllum commune]
MGASNNFLLYLTLFIVLSICMSHHGVFAFGAGNIPSFAYLEGKAFRHGDIEDVLANLSKAGGGFALNKLFGGGKFRGLDIKRVYFGNWLRDYSQAVDIAALQKVPLQTIINLCMVLGFMAHGYATNEFEVTAERLGTYLPTEHIDNPKGYGGNEDPRKYHPNLRPPVDPRELEIDPHTGMKNYIANENGHWDTSKALVRRTFLRCIDLGRRGRGGSKPELYESYRLLGQALHTLEDFPAHSNFCELVLVSMGHGQVFTHVGDGVRVQAPNGRHVAPLVTGTFGSSDFIHSLLGEATDHLSQASVTDLNHEMENAKQRSRDRSGPGGGGDTSTLRELFSLLPDGSGGELSRDMDSVSGLRDGTANGKRPEDMSPQELHAVLWKVLSFRDAVAKKISKTIEKIPGLGPLIEKIMDGISVFVFTTLEPFLKPLLKTSTSALSAASGEVIDNQDQYEVFNRSNASDPTHSFLSKDHFNLILNEPAGLIAKTIVTYAVTRITNAWNDDSVNPGTVVEDILQCLFHPDWHNRQSQIQVEMMQTMHNWFSQMRQDRQQTVLQRLTKQAVRDHKNIRLQGEGGEPEAVGSYAYNEGHAAQNALLGYAQGIPGVSQASGFINQVQGAFKPSGPGRDAPGEASGYYGGGSSASPGYAPPSGPPPPNSSSYPGGGGSSYTPPSGPPPGSGGSSFPSAPAHAGYTPAYGSPAPPSDGPGFPGYSSGAPSSGYPGGPGGSSYPGGPGFPGGPGSSYPGGPGGYGGSPPPMGFPGGPPGGPGFPGGPPPPGGFGGPSPGGPGFPGGPPGGPGFPGANPYGGGLSYPGAPHHHGGQSGYPGSGW